MFTFTRFKKKLLCLILVLEVFQVQASQKIGAQQLEESQSKIPGMQYRVEEEILANSIDQIIKNACKAHREDRNNDFRIEGAYYHVNDKTFVLPAVFHKHYVGDVIAMVKSKKNALSLHEEDLEFTLIESSFEPQDVMCDAFVHSLKIYQESNRSLCESSEVHKAIAELNLERLRQLAKEDGTDLNAKSIVHGLTPIHFAVKNFLRAEGDAIDTSVEVIEFLLEQEVDLNIPCVDDGNTVIFQPIDPKITCDKFKRMGILELLLATNRCALKVKNKDGDYPYQYALNFILNDKNRSIDQKLYINIVKVLADATGISFKIS